MSIALNRSGELAEWDSATLARHLDELSMGDDGFNPDDLGFTDEEFMSLIADLDVVDEGEVGLDELAGDGGEATTDGNQDLLPHGMQPGHLPSSHVRMIQLFFNENTEPEVRLWCKRLADRYETDNITDTIYFALKEVAATLEE